MPNATQKKRTWAGYACPVCRFVFRVPKDHEGAGVICPACDHLLNIPTQEETRSYLSKKVSGGFSQAGAGGEGRKAIESRPLTSADAETGASSTRSARRSSASASSEGSSRRRGRSRDVQPSWESESSSSEGRHGSSMGMVVGGSMIGLTVIAIAAWLVMGAVDDGDKVRRVGGGQSDAGLPESVTAGVKGPVVDDEVNEDAEVSESVTAATDVMALSENVVRSFLTAESAADLEGLVRTPEVTIPRMREWYKHHTWEAPGVTNTCVGNKVTVKGGMASMLVMLGDYSSRMIALERSGGDYLIDWESWVAWSEMGWEDLFTKRPTESVEVRALCQVDNYYNRLFRDEAKWLAVKLEYPGGERLIYGYIDQANDSLSRLVGDLIRGRSEPLTLKIRYPEGAVADNQVIIDEYVQHGWVRMPKGAGGESGSEPELRPKTSSKTSPKQIPQADHE